MKARPPYRLGSLQLKIMAALWQRGEATVADLHRDLGRRANLAYVTVATVLRRMETKGLVTHRNEGRSFLYRAAVAEKTVRRNLASEYRDHLRQGPRGLRLDRASHRRDHGDQGSSEPSKAGDRQPLGPAKGPSKRIRSLHHPSDVPAEDHRRREEERREEEDQTVFRTRKEGSAGSERGR